MTIVYLIVACAVLWIVWKILRSNPQQSRNSPELPISVRVTFEPSEASDAQSEEIDSDAWEGSFWEVQEPFPVKASLRIKYEDGNGKKTERTVDIRQLGTTGYGHLLIGHCRMRDATRTFRVDRIQECVDLETGELVTDVYSYLRQKYENSPEYSRDKFFEDEYDLMRVLLYVGKADGQLRAAERNIICETCRVLVEDSRITNEMVEETFSQLAIPTLQAFRLAVGRLASKPPNLRDTVVIAAEKMIATQKTVHPSETEALEYMKKRFASPSFPSAAVSTQ
jgi:hypothetical protein